MHSPSSLPLSLRRCGLVAAAILATGGLLQVLFEPVAGTSATRTGDLGGLALMALATLPLAFSHRFPRGVVVVTVASVFTAILLGYSVGVSAVGCLVAVALSAAQTTGRDALVFTMLAIVGFVTAPYLLDPAPAISAGATNAAAIGLAGLAGAAIRLQGRYALQLAERTRELEQMHDLETREAVALERVRIAREVHDGVGHALAAIRLHAKVAQRRLTRDPPAATSALNEIAGLASVALAETRGAVGQLRAGADDAELRPRPRLDDLGELVAGLRASDVEIEVRCDPSARTAPGAVQAAAYRIVQESLSNLVKHASATRARITIRRDAAGLEIEVQDDGRGFSRASNVGYGLIGMRERAMGLGGTLEVSPAPEGGLSVHAMLPINHALP
jgi:signal transduction histidine kinase